MFILYKRAIISIVCYNLFCGLLKYSLLTFNVTDGMCRITVLNSGLKLLQYWYHL